MKLKVLEKTAFTLAEVLITLGIIGVVAALTLPALIQKNRNKELQTGLKKAYSVISQALDMYQAETGERLKADGSLTEHGQLGTILQKYFNIIKNCGYAYSSDNYSSDNEADSRGCIPNDSTSREEGSAYKTFNGSTFINLDKFDDSQFILNDGMLLMIENQAQATTDPLYISVDVNGYKKRPNRLGQDLFLFQIDSRGKLLPMGVPNSDYYDANDAYCSASSSNNMNGAGCTYKALIEKDFFQKMP